MTIRQGARSRQGGYVLVLVLMLTAAISTAAISMAYFSEVEARASTKNRGATEALNTALAGLRRAVRATAVGGATLGNTLSAVVGGGSAVLDNITFNRWGATGAYTENIAAPVLPAWPSSCTPFAIGSGQVCAFLMDDPQDVDNVPGADANRRLLVRVFARVGDAEAIVGQVVNRPLPPPPAVAAGGNVTIGNGAQICGSGGIGGNVLNVGGGSECICGAVMGNSYAGPNPPADGCGCCDSEVSVSTGIQPPLNWPTWWPFAFGSYDRNVSFGPDSLASAGTTANNVKTVGAIWYLTYWGTILAYNGAGGCPANPLEMVDDWFPPPDPTCFAAVVPAGGAWNFTVPAPGPTWTVTIAAAAGMPRYLIAGYGVHTLNLTATDGGNFLRMTVLTYNKLNIAGVTRLVGAGCGAMLSAGPPVACDEAGANATAVAANRECFAIRAGDSLLWNANLYTVGAVWAKDINGVGSDGCIIGDLAGWGTASIPGGCAIGGGTPAFCGTANICFKNGTDFIVGNIMSNGTFCSKNNANSYGSVYAAGSVGAQNGFDITGTITAGVDIELKNNSVIDADEDMPPNNRTDNIAFEMLK